MGRLVDFRYGLAMIAAATLTVAGCLTAPEPPAEPLEPATTDDPSAANEVGPLNGTASDEAPSGAEDERARIVVSHHEVFEGVLPDPGGDPPLGPFGTAFEFPVHEEAVAIFVNYTSQYTGGYHAAISILDPGGEDFASNAEGCSADLPASAGVGMDGECRFLVEANLSSGMWTVRVDQTITDVRETYTVEVTVLARELTASQSPAGA